MMKLSMEYKYQNKENNWNSQLQNHSVLEYFNSKL